MLIWPFGVIKDSNLDNVLAWERLASSEQGGATVRAEMRDDLLARVCYFGNLLRSTCPCVSKGPEFSKTEAMALRT